MTAVPISMVDPAPWVSRPFPGFLSLAYRMQITWIASRPGDIPGIQVGQGRDFGEIVAIGPGAESGLKKSVKSKLLLHSNLRSTSGENFGGLLNPRGGPLNISLVERNKRPDENKRPAESPKTTRSAENVEVVANSEGGGFVGCL
jgi:hypothetical protein